MEDAAMSSMISPCRRFCLAIALALITFSASHQPASAADSSAEFSKPVIDIGIVVSDLAKSAAFYTNALGFKEVPGFKVTAERATEIGLTDHQPADIRVFVLGEGNLATRIKLMSFLGAPGKQPDQKFLHSTVGLRYLTLYVTDINTALKRLEKVKLLGKTPTDLGGGTWIVVCQNPDGNFVELVGPRK
jgi:catechol 2,3-dioxygenase-like lactoylglutathione lyase family enzyme